MSLIINHKKHKIFKWVTHCQSQERHWVGARSQDGRSQDFGGAGVCMVETRGAASLLVFAVLQFEFGDFGFEGFAF